MAKMPFKKYFKYPHLGPEDTKIWNAFIKNHPHFFSEVEYDVKIGEGQDYSDYPENEIRKDLEYLSKKRIDVVGLTANEIYVVELKPKAGMTAIGQALSLAELFREEIHTNRIVLPCIITNAEIPDMRQLCQKLSVIYLLCE